MLIIINIKKSSGELAGDVEIISRGFIYVKESEVLIDGAKKLITETVNKEDTTGRSERIALKAKVKREVSNFLYNKTKRRPMVIPIVIGRYKVLGGFSSFKAAFNEYKRLSGIFGI